MKIENNSYSGQIYINNNEDSFIFLSLVEKLDFAISYRVPRVEKLSLKIEKGADGPLSILLTLEKTKYELKKEEVLQLSFKTRSFMTNLNYTKFNKDLYITDGIKCESKERAVEIILNYQNRFIKNIVINPESKFSDIRQFLSDISFKKFSDELFYSIDDQIIGDSNTFITYCTRHQIMISVTSKCYLTPITDDDSTKVLRWNQNSFLMTQELSILLGIHFRTIQLVNLQGIPLEENSILNIDDFRTTKTNNSPNLFYEIIGGKMKCMPMKDKENILEVMVFGDRTVSEIKERLEWKLKIDKNRLILCKNNLLLPNEEVVSSDENLKYYIGLSYDNIESKSLVGQGSFGEVYRCKEISSDKVFALKTFLLPSNEKEIKGDLIREFHVMSVLTSHDNIVNYLDIYVDGNDFSMAMEYIPGGSLRDYLANNEPLQEEDIRKFSKDILRGLQYLHSNNILHRDIKSPNILLSKEKVAKLCDFGLSRILTGLKRTDLSNGIKLTTQCGTFRWMAPEVMRSENYGTKADVWSFGAVLIELITGHIPYNGYSNAQAIINIGRTKKIPYTPPRRLSNELQNLVDCCLKENASERPNVNFLLSHAFFQN